MVSTFPTGQWAISCGDQVYTADGHRLGAVTRADAYEIEVESGLFFRRRYVLAHPEIDGYEDGVLTSILTLDEAKAREQR